MELVELPFYREQLRWALACYRANNQLGVPTLRKRMIEVLGQERIEKELSATDIYNFLGGSTQTRAFKLKVILEFLEVRAPEYVRALSNPEFLLTLCDYMFRFSMTAEGSASYADEHKKQAEELTGRTFVCDNFGGRWPVSHSSEYAKKHNKKKDWGSFPLSRKLQTNNKYASELAGVVSCLSFRRIEKSRYMQFLAFNVDADLKAMSKYADRSCLDHDRFQEALSHELEIQALINSAIIRGNLKNEITIRNLYSGILVPTANPFEYIGLGKTPDHKLVQIAVRFREPWETIDDVYWISVRAINGFNLGKNTLDALDPLENHMIPDRDQRENTEIQFIDEFVAAADWSMP